MTAQQLFSSLAQIISLSSVVVVLACATRQFLTDFATKRTTAQNGVAFRDAGNLHLFATEKKMHAMAGEIVISI